MTPEQELTNRIADLAARLDFTEKELARVREELEHWRFVGNTYKLIANGLVATAETLLSLPVAQKSA